MSVCLSVVGWVKRGSLILLPHRANLMIVRKKNRDFHVRMLRMMWSGEKSGLEKMPAVFMCVCGARVKGRKNESLVLRKWVELSSCNLVCYRSWYYLYSTVILKEYFENIPLKSCNIAKMFIKLLERFLEYWRNLAISIQNIINGILLQY